MSSLVAVGAMRGFCVFMQAGANSATPSLEKGPMTAMTLLSLASVSLRAVRSVESSSCHSILRSMARVSAFCASRKFWRNQSAVRSRRVFVAASPMGATTATVFSTQWRAGCNTTVSSSCLQALKRVSSTVAAANNFSLFTFIFSLLILGLLSDSVVVDGT